MLSTTCLHPSSMDTAIKSQLPSQIIASFTMHASASCGSGMLMTVNYSLFLVSFSSHFGVHKAT